jgi:predicted transcriptional regulator
MSREGTKARRRLFCCGVCRTCMLRCMSTERNDGNKLPCPGSPEFAAEARRESRLIAESPWEADDQAFIDAISEFSSASIERGLADAEAGRTKPAMQVFERLKRKYEAMAGHRSSSRRF